MSEEYFLYPLVEELKSCQNPERRQRIRERLAANIGDPQVLAELLGESPSNFYPKTSTEPSDSIDAFIARYRRPGDPSDISEILEPKAQRYSKKITSPPSTLKPISTSQISMEEVKELVKNHQYERALAIMDQFYLNNPKKSVYFADQIRFIRKMELIYRKKNN